MVMIRMMMVMIMMMMVMMTDSLSLLLYRFETIMVMYHRQNYRHHPHCRYLIAKPSNIIPYQAEIIFIKWTTNLPLIFQKSSFVIPRCQAFGWQKSQKIPPSQQRLLKRQLSQKASPPNTNMSGCQTNEIRDLFKSLKQVAQDLVTEADRENIFMYFFLFRQLRW